MIKTVEIDTLSVAYKIIEPTQKNSDTPVVLLHDSLGCISVWRNFPEQLAEKLTQPVMVYDRVGYGKSSPFPPNYVRTNNYLEQEADFLIRFLDELKINDALLFGHSDGGSIALIAAAKYPQKIKSIITEGAHTFVEDVTLNGIRDAIKVYETTDLPNKLIKHHGNKTEAVFKAWTQTWLSPMYKDWNIIHFVSKITCPTLTFYGDKDEYGTLEQAYSIENNCKGICRTIIIENIGHTPHKESTERVLNETIGFLEQLKHTI